MHARAGREHEVCMRAIENESSRALPHAGREEALRREASRRRVKHREQRADRNVGVYAVRTVERIERDQKGALGVERHGLVALLGDDGANAGAAEPVHEGLVRKYVERFLCGSVMVWADRGVEVAGETAATDEMGERQSGFGECAKNKGERLGRMGGEKGVEIRAGRVRSNHEPSHSSRGSGAVRPSGTIEICLSKETDLILPRHSIKVNANAGTIVRNLSLRHIETLQAIAAAGSLVQAAAKLNMTPAALTARVKGLEEAVALKLFDRTSTGMRLTKAGESALEASLGVERAIRHFADTMKAISDGEGGRLSVGAVSTAKYFAPRLIAAFVSSRPEARSQIPDRQPRRDDRVSARRGSGDCADRTSAARPAGRETSRRPPSLCADRAARAPFGARQGT